MSPLATPNAKANSQDTNEKGKNTNLESEKLGSPFAMGQCVNTSQQVPKQEYYYISLWVWSYGLLSTNLLVDGPNNLASN